jgi:hypothetical protein
VFSFEILNSPTCHLQKRVNGPHLLLVIARRAVMWRQKAEPKVQLGSMKSESPADALGLYCP